MGRDKYENEDLLKYAEAEDFWFHVDDLSSAHVYLKPQAGWTLDTIPVDILTDCAQLVKANSIEGNKKNDVRVVYTPASNLRKESGFDVGQVAYHNSKLVDRRVNEIVNRLNKTKEEKTIDFAAEMAARLQTDKRRWKDEQQRVKQREDEERRCKQQQDELLSYGSVFKSADMSSNKGTGSGSYKKFEEDFF